MSKYTVSQGNRLILADSRLADLDMGKMSTAMGANDINEVLGAFKDLGSNQITLLAAEFVPPEAPSPVAVKEGRSTAKSAQTAPLPSTTTTEATPATEVAEPAPRRRNALRSQTQRGTGKIA